MLATGMAAYRPRAVPVEVTYCKDVAPILYRRCASCHRPGEVAPFSLMTYQDAAKRARQLSAVTRNRLMPPWRPAPGYGEFRDARRLTDEEVATIQRWAEAGAPEGNPRELPPRPAFADGWQMGEPDLVLTMPQPFTVPADGPDLFQCFVIRIPLSGDQYVAGFEVRPGNRRVVHHALMFLDATGRARQKDAEDPAPGYSSFGDPGFLPTGALGAWAPGVTPFRLPEGVGTMLRRGSDLVMQVHYHPTGKVEADQTKVGLYLLKSLPKKIAVSLPILKHNLDIPPGVKRHREATAFSTPVDLEVIGITPHMHLLGQEMKTTALLPDGSTTPMIWIKEWDFNWQGQYQYVRPLYLPRGSRIDMEAFYDNSADNPLNPNRPPERVGWGPESTDEMALCMILVAVDRFSETGPLRDAILKQPGFAHARAAH
jgi:hypothetical protein